MTTSADLRQRLAAGWDRRGRLLAQGWWFLPGRNWTRISFLPVVGAGNRTGTGIATFLIVFLIQSTQNRDSRAINLKPQ